MSSSLDLIMGTIQRLLQEARPSTVDSHLSLYWLILSQLQKTKRLFDDFSKELQLDWRGLIYEELYRVVTRINTLVHYPEDISIPAEARGEHFLESLLDLRWWTWVIALQVEALLINLTLYDTYFSRFKGVFETNSSSIPFGGNSASRRLPSYNFELWQQRTGRCLRGALWLNKMGDEGKKEFVMLLTDIMDAQLPDFDMMKQLGSTKLRDAGKPCSIGDYLPIDLTKGLLGAGSTGYVIGTTCPDGQGGSFPCALKRIDTMDENEPDLARLWHPHVVHLIHHWREKSGLHCKDRERMPNSPFMTFLVMELMGGDLAELITTHKKARVTPFSLLATVDIMLQIAKGMLYLHEMGVSHPHLKCDNVLCRVESNSQAPFQVGDVLVKLGGFGCSRTANDDTKNRDVFCFGLTCLEILTGSGWSEGIYEVDKVSRPTIPESTPPILKHCIESCLDINLTFSEVVMLLLLAQCQMMQTSRRISDNDEMIRIVVPSANNQGDPASSSTSKGGREGMFHVHQLHPQLDTQLDEGPTYARMTLIFFHGFPKVSEEWRMTWMTRDNKLVWTQMWLPEDLGGNIRVLSVSFDDHPNVKSSESIKGLLLNLVTSYSRTEQAIILVGHCFGGVILKALVTEAESLVRQGIQKGSDKSIVTKCEKFRKSLASIVFYSVPHSLTNTEFKNYILGCSNTRVLQKSSLLKSLREDSGFIPEMIQLSMDFETTVPRKTKVLAFLEGKPMSKKCFLVTEASCVQEKFLSWEWHKVDKDNHFEVCRPISKSHIGYEILLRHLKQHMIADIPTVTDIPASTSNDYGMSSQHPIELVVNKSFIEAYSKPVNDLNLVDGSFGKPSLLNAAERSIHQSTRAMKTVQTPIKNFSTKWDKDLTRSRKDSKELDKDSTKLGKYSRKSGKRLRKLMQARSGNATRSKTDSPIINLDSSIKRTSNVQQVEEVDESIVVSDLITKLSSHQIEVHRDAAKKVRHLTRMNKENRDGIIVRGGLMFLIHDLQSPDKMTQEHAITALRNLSLEESARGLIMTSTEAIDSIVHVVRFGQSMEARRNAATTIQYLSNEIGTKISIGKTGAIPALVELLGVGTHKEKKAAAGALCNLVSCRGGDKISVGNDLIRVLMDVLISVLMDILHSDDSTNELEETSLSILENLMHYPNGLFHIRNTKPAAMLIDFITLGSYRAKDLATALLCKLSSDDPSFIKAAYHCGATIPLEALLRDDDTTDRCKRNATHLLDLLTRRARPKALMKASSGKRKSLCSILLQY